jgi:hypothetical protein
MPVLLQFTLEGISMKTTDFVKFAGAVLALAACSACAGDSGGSTVTPFNAVVDGGHVGRMAFVNGRPVTAARPNLNGVTRYPTVLANLAAGSKTKYFDYIISYYATYASIFNYPTGEKQIGTLHDVGGQGCTNVLYGYGKKIIWIAESYNQITEYQVPAKAIKTLSISDGTSPSSCAMNTSGDLAVGLLFGATRGDVVIFKKATGAGTFVKTPLAEAYSDGYDNKGNLFVDGYTSGYAFQLDEIAKGSKTVKTIATSDAVGVPGSVQWDGKYLTILDQDTNILHQYTVSGT